MFSLKNWRRRRLLKQPFPAEWLAVVERNVPYYRLLGPEDQHELQRLIQIFVGEKTFEGCGGQQITDEVRITIAAQACVLLLNRETDVYPALRTILVYPQAYVVPVKARQEGGLVTEGVEVRRGESWAHGAVVLAWDAVQGAADMPGGHNVILHEFAHQLDNEAGVADGAPLLPAQSMYVAWARVLGQEYQALLEDLAQDRPAFLGDYAAKNPAEFFAVATEFFFEQPVALRALRPALYEQLKLFYRQDPAELVQTAARERGRPN